MSSFPQEPKPQEQKGGNSNSANSGRVGNNIRKDEPTAQKKPISLKDNANPSSGSKSTVVNKPSKSS